MTTENESSNIGPAYLSSSSISTWEQCPQRYKYGRIDKIPEPENESQVIGTFVHEILEQLYTLPSDQRTMGNAQQMSRHVWATSGWPERLAGIGLNDKQMREFRWKSWWCVENLWMIEDPVKIVPIGLEKEYLVELLPGINVKGFIDRVSTSEQGTKVTDYKTGKFPRPQYVAQKWFQLFLYKLMVEKTTDLQVSEVELIYLKDGKKLNKRPDKSDDTETLERVASVHVEIIEAMQTGEFPTKVSRLCDWCHYKKICPAWAAKRSNYGKPRQ